MDLELKKVVVRLKINLTAVLIKLTMFQAFTEMQVNKVETTKKIRILDSQVDMLKKSWKKLALTSKELNGLAKDSNVYAAVGRMFVMSSIPEIKDDLKSKQDKLETVIESCDKSKDVLQKNIKEQENALRELVDAKKKESK
jgi:prefoldin subunit 1